MTATLARRIDALERTAPSGVKRPEGLSGDAFIRHMFAELNKVADRPGREQIKIRAAYYDLLTFDELRRAQAILETEVLRRGGGGGGADKVVFRLGNRRGTT